MHFKTNPDTNSLRKSPTRNNVLNYSASTTVGYFKQTAHKQLMHFFFPRAVAILYGSCSSLVSSNMKLIFTGRSTVVRFPLQMWTFIFVTFCPDSLAASYSTGTVIKGQRTGPSSPPSNDKFSIAWSFVSNFAKPTWHVATSNLDFNTISYFVNVCNSRLLPLNYLPYICDYTIQCTSFLPLLDYRTST